MPDSNGNMDGIGDYWSVQWVAIGETLSAANVILYFCYIKSWEYLPGVLSSIWSFDNLFAISGNLSGGSSFARFLEAIVLLRSIASFFTGMTRGGLTDSDVAIHRARQARVRDVIRVPHVREPTGAAMTDEPGVYLYFNALPPFLLYSLLPVDTPSLPPVLGGTLHSYRLQHNIV